MKKKDNRGGAREGAGRRKAERSFSPWVKKMVVKALKEKAKETGEDLGKVIVALAYSTQANAKAAALKLIADILVTRESKTTVETKTISPVIMLPQTMEAPPEAKDRTKELTEGVAVH